MDPNVEGDYSFSMEIVKQNVRIPLILIDECNDVLQSRNLNIPEYIENDSDEKLAYFRYVGYNEANRRFNLYRCFWRKTNSLL